ncbi:hypothetical protein QFC24_000934 [Naganishia onofrii]|uniref:Uncharacterized protein n=1 Tax=Naganishia onofrii TaxID=1851511 RepID=A0ACC2XU44_9TREE|nr:hypothetical protein QFC24_000934 [Naganishia onofrii]
MMNRKEDQGDRAIEDIKNECKEKGLPAPDISWRGVDLGDFQQTKEVFAALASEEARLDILVLSSGINANQFRQAITSLETYLTLIFFADLCRLAASGVDGHMSVNAFGHFLAINQLYPLLRKTSKIANAPAPRIVFESSEMHRFAPSNVHFGSLEEINDETIDPTQLYGRTKLAMICYTKAILEKVIKPNNDNIYILAVHPGAVNTEMQEQWTQAYPGVVGSAIKAVSVGFSRDPEQGSYSALYAALSDEIIEKNWNGYYLIDPAKEGKESAQGSDKWLIAALWDLSHRLIKEKVGQDALAEWSS